MHAECSRPMLYLLDDVEHISYHNVDEYVGTWEVGRCRLISIMLIPELVCKLVRRF